MLPCEVRKLAPKFAPSTGVRRDAHSCHIHRCEHLLSSTMKRSYNRGPGAVINADTNAELYDGCDWLSTMPTEILTNIFKVTLSFSPSHSLSSQMNSTDSVISTGSSCERHTLPTLHFDSLLSCHRQLRRQVGEAVESAWRDHLSEQGEPSRHEKLVL